MKINEFLSPKEKDLIVASIKDAEMKTSGEIRVHIESKCKTDLMERAVYIFNRLNMHKTALRNGVLIYIALKDKRFAIIGDCGINSKVPSDFWNEIRNQIAESFKNGEFCSGICKAIKETGRALKSYFPYQTDDINEQPDEISFGE